jgi:hypothetical protein
MSSRDIEAYNNNYFNTVAWADCVAKHKLPNKKPFFRSNFSDVVPAVGNAAAQRVFTDFSEYSYHYWEYDPDRGVYLRFQETNDTHEGKLEVYTPLMDNVTGEQVNASNVIVLFAYHTFANPFNEDDEVYQIDLTGTGEAYVFRDGIGIPAIWNRLTVDQPLILTTNYGEQIPLKPGITFYEVIGTESYASQGDGEWFFHHETP